jgi:hypothetical protein
MGDRKTYLTMRMRLRRSLKAVWPLTTTDSDIDDSEILQKQLHLHFATTFLFRKVVSIGIHGSDLKITRIRWIWPAGASNPLHSHLCRSKAKTTNSGVCCRDRMLCRLDRLNTDDFIVITPVSTIDNKPNNQIAKVPASLQ